MTNIVTVANGTFFTSASAQEIEGQIARGITWVTLHPTGTLLNLAHVVSIEDDEPRLELPEVPGGPAQGAEWPC